MNGGVGRLRYEVLSLVEEGEPLRVNCLGGRRGCISEWCVPGVVTHRDPIMVSLLLVFISHTQQLPHTHRGGITLAGIDKDLLTHEWAYRCTVFIFRTIIHQGVSHYLNMG